MGIELKTDQSLCGHTRYSILLSFKAFGEEHVIQFVRRLKVLRTYVLGDSFQVQILSRAFVNKILIQLALVSLWILRHYQFHR